eukprot:365737_1
MSNTLYHSDGLTNKVVATHSHLLHQLQKMSLSERGTIRGKSNVIPLGKSANGLCVDTQFLEGYIYPSLGRIGIPRDLFKLAMRYCDKNTEISKQCLVKGLKQLKKHNTYIKDENDACISDYKVRKKREYNEVTDIYAEVDDLWHYKKAWSEIAAFHECITKIINGDVVDIGILLKSKMTKDANSENKTFDEYLKSWISSKSEL